MTYRTIKTPDISGTITIDEVEQMVRGLEVRKNGRKKHDITNVAGTFGPITRISVSHSKTTINEKEKPTNPIKRRRIIDVIN